MEYTDSSPKLISDLVMSMICTDYPWYKTTSACPEQSNEIILELLRDTAVWKEFHSAYSSKLGYWKRRKLRSLYFHPKQDLVVKQSKIIVGIYSQIRIKREYNKTIYIDGVKYSDFENNMYSYDFEVNPNTLFDRPHSDNVRQLKGEAYSCHTYINNGFNLPLCSSCEGKGFFSCPKCGGSGLGELEKVGNYASGQAKLKRVNCTNCHGAGQIQCDVCHGSGKINIRSERYQELKFYKEIQTAQMSVLAKMPFSNDLMQILYTPKEYLLNTASRNDTFNKGRLILSKKSAFNSVIDERNEMLRNANDIERNVLDLYYNVAYDDNDGFVAYSKEDYIQIPMTTIICYFHNVPHVIYAITNYKKQRGTYIPVTTFITKALS